MYIATFYCRQNTGIFKRGLSSGGIKWLFVSLFNMYCAFIYIYTHTFTLFQNCILLKDSRISPCICSKKDFGSKTIRTGVSLHGATSKRASMWHSPVFTCIRPNRIPVKGIKRTAVRNFEMQVDIPSHWANRQLVLIKFIMGIITDIIISSDARKQTYLTSGVSS